MFLLKGSQRKIARLLKINRKTVARKIRFLGLQAHASRTHYLKRYQKSKAELVQFDDIITFEHTKLKPVAISLMIEEGSRKVLDFEVSSMAANGKLAQLSVKKYGKRQDDRSKNWRELFKRCQGKISEEAIFKSDEHPSYPKLVKEFFPKGKHLKFKGRRGCVVGQGELKAIGFDPIFSLNHTAAMFRDSLGQLVRRTWCTTKRLDSLKAQLEIYIDYHNREATP